MALVCKDIHAYDRQLIFIGNYCRNFLLQRKQDAVLQSFTFSIRDFCRHIGYFGFPAGDTKVPVSALGILHPLFLRDSCLSKMVAKKSIHAGISKRTKMTRRNHI